MDRNLLLGIISGRLEMVALLAEGVDRNELVSSVEQFAVVALLAEGVDRNLQSLQAALDGVQSPSSRRAWIEIRPYPG